MRKIGAALVVLVTLAAVGGCGGGRPEKAETPPQTVRAPKEKPGAPVHAQ
jgi:hypothetical protein